MAMFFLYYIIIFVAISISLLLSFFIPLPEFLDKQIFNSIGIGFTVLFTAVLNIPQHARDFIKNKLENSSPKTTADILIRKAAGEEITDTNHVFYEDFLEYRGNINYANEPYSLANSGSIQFWLRLIIGVLSIIIGLCGLLVGTNAEDKATTLVNSWVFWLVIGSLTVLFFGFVVIWAGFLRAFAVPVLTMLLLGISYYLYVFLSGVSEVSTSGYYLFIIILSFSVLLFFYWLFKALRRKFRQTLVYYENNNCIYGTDLAFMDACPINNYDRYAFVTIPVSDLDMYSLFYDFNNKINHFCQKKKLILASAIMERQREYKLYIYYSKEKQLDALNVYIKKTITKNYQMISEQDSDWNYYKNFLYPEKANLIKLQNRALMERLEQQNYDFTMAQPIIFVVLFCDKDKAIAFRDVVREQDYDKVIYIDNSKDAAQGNLSKKYYHQIYVKKTFKLSLAWLNIEALKLYLLSKGYDGEYEWITVGEIDEVENDEVE